MAGIPFRIDIGRRTDPPTKPEAAGPAAAAQRRRRDLRSPQRSQVQAFANPSINASTRTIRLGRSEAFVQKLDLGRAARSDQSVEGQARRDANDTRILRALALRQHEGVGSAATRTL